MKKLLLPIVVLLFIGMLAFAEGAPKGGDFGINTVVLITSTGASGGALGAKYFATDNIGFRAALGLENASSAGASTTGYDFGVGFEYHFGGKGGVSPYAGAELGYSGAAYSAGGPTPSEFAINGVFGAEYFFSSNFSWAGEIQVGYTSQNTVVAGTTVNTTYFGLGSVNIILTWYIN
jgi:outer membrane protein W